MVDVRACTQGWGDLGRTGRSQAANLLHIQGSVSSKVIYIRFGVGELAFISREKANEFLSAYRSSK